MKKLLTGFALLLSFSIIAAETNEHNNEDSLFYKGHYIGPGADTRVEFNVGGKMPLNEGHYVGNTGSPEECEIIINRVANGYEVTYTSEGYPDWGVEARTNTIEVQDENLSPIIVHMGRGRIETYSHVKYKENESITKKLYKVDELKAVIKGGHLYDIEIIYEESPRKKIIDGFDHLAKIFKVNGRKYRYRTVDSYKCLELTKK